MTGRDAGGPTLDPPNNKPVPSPPSSISGISSIPMPGNGGVASSPLTRDGDGDGEREDPGRRGWDDEEGDRTKGSCADDEGEGG